VARSTARSIAAIADSASASRPASASQRGDSGIVRRTASTTSDSRPTTTKAQRQPRWGRTKKLIAPERT
jgi:hypothetical protein